MGSLLIALSFLISKLLGLFRDALLASQFGASAGEGIFNLDTYYAALRLPDLIFNLLSYGILSTAFVPIFVAIYRKEGREEAGRFASEALVLVGGAIAVISIILALGADYFVPIFVPGFSEEAIAITIRATRMMMTTPLLFSIASIASGVSNSLHRYIAIALGPITYNIGIIGGIVWLAPKMGVFGVVWGVIAGALLNLMVQLPSAVRGGMRIVRGVRLLSARTKEMLRLSVPRIIGMSVSQVALVVDTVLASTMATGSITVINIAVNIEHIPIGLVATSIAVVSFASLSHHAAEDNMEAFAKEVKGSLHCVLFLMLPMSAGLFILRLPITTLLFGRGQFGAGDIALTANTLGMLSVGIVFAGLVYVLSRGFYALKNTKTPVKISLMAIAGGTALSVITTKLLGLGTLGLAAGHSIANIVQAVTLFVMLQRTLKMGLMAWREVFLYMVSTSAMSAAVYLLTAAHAHLLVVIIAAGFFYFALAIALKSAEGLRYKAILERIIEHKAKIT